MIAELSADERRQAAESIRRVSEALAGGLRRAASADEAAAFIVHLHRALDGVAAAEVPAALEPACREGCSHCCRARVEATEPEIFRIASHLRQLAGDGLQTVIARLREHVAHVSAQPRPCSFLVQDRCSIYAIRPGACRAAHSLSEEACRRQAALIPQNLRRAAESQVLIAGVAEAYALAGLPVRSHELNAAVLRALEHAPAQAEWFGEGPVAGDVR